MVAANYNFTTGATTLPDIGEINYNGCSFGPLFETNVSGNVVKDNAGRTTKFMEYTITADGYVTLSEPVNQAESIDDNMTQLRTLLTAQGGVLKYQGRGMDMLVNIPGENERDVAWGPVPELLEFEPLGQGRSAKVKWSVKVRICEQQPGKVRPVLQFNNETVVNYDDAGYSQLSIKGTLEIPLTRITQSNLTTLRTVDQFREQYVGQVLDNIDLTRFRVTKREFAISRDKRTMEWSVQAEELPYMGLPPNVTVARGMYTVQPSKTGMGLASWICQLRVQYTVAKNQDRRVAWDAFLLLLRVRMRASAAGATPQEQGNQNPQPTLLGAIGIGAITPLALSGPALYQQLFGQQNPAVNNPTANRRAWLMDFRIEEGLYLDSKTVTFSASWRLVTTFSTILVASGVWKKVASDGGNTWAASVRDISGWKSWERNLLDPAAAIIVDFGT